MNTERKGEGAQMCVGDRMRCLACDCVLFSTASLFVLRR